MIVVNWWHQRRERKAREWRDRTYNGHDMYVSHEAPNEPVELTCRLCGYATKNVDCGWSIPLHYWPYPIKDPCPVGNDR